MINLKRNPDGSVNVAAELRDMAGYLRCIEPQQPTAAAHLERIADELKPRPIAEVTADVSVTLDISADEVDALINALRHALKDRGWTPPSELPPECPPLPDGAVYAGRLADYPLSFPLPGWTWERGDAEWMYSRNWLGTGPGQPDCANWWYAKPATIGDCE